jgi:hypothetical protein
VTPLQEKTIELARSQLDVTEHPHGSNRGPEVDGYLREVGLDPAAGHYPWCAAFASSMVLRASKELGTVAEFRGSASGRHLVEINRGLLIPEPEEGCVFVHFTDDGVHTHVGFVEKFRSDGAQYTVEGNADRLGSRTGGSVVEQIRSRSYVNRWIRIA